MILTKKEAKTNLKKLIVKYRHEVSAGRINEYNEEATKTVFIQPLLKTVLGWDVNNRDEVSPEERTSKGRVDYGLKIDGETRLFVEVKPPKADLDKHIKQAVGYSYNRRSVPFVLLTDFEGLKLFDVTIKPDTRNMKRGLKLDLDWQQYLAKFDKIWFLSKESVLKGELEKLLIVKPKDRSPVDKAILNDLKRWREILTKDIFKNNTALFHSEDREKDANYLKEITQRILDRIIFMRSCEDRKLVHRDSLKKSFEERIESVGKHTMLFLTHEFMHYNNIFDSDLFRPQEWEKDLVIDFKVMRDIIMETYNLYQFDVIPLEVLGNIYEQYLGYTVRLTDHQVKYELKPEVRKAGGVYYTPEYIVDYIVKNTVGKLLKELSVRRIKKLRILDPACGSGGFLIRAYAEMLNYYKNQKLEKPRHKIGQKEFDLEHEELPQLTLQEKSQILQEHIFGVDIDEQAVEVTKLSLMLKMLEDEFGIIPGRSILPMLDKNIRCGNSLVSGDTLELKKWFGDDWYKMKAFDWQERFDEIMVNEGGFSVVIGNPPYVTEKLSRCEREYFKKTYPESTVGKPNTYRIFTHKGWQLLQDMGFFGFIIPNTYLTNRDSQLLRKFLLGNSKLKQILLFPEKLKVFEKVTQATTILIFQKTLEGRRDNIIQIVDPVNNISRLTGHPFRCYPQQIFMNMCENMIVTRRTPEQIAIVNRIIDKEPSLKSLVDIFQGEVNVSICKQSIANRRKNRNFRPLLRGTNVDRYYVDLSFADKKGSWIDASKSFRNHQRYTRIVTQEVSNMQQQRRLKCGIIDSGIYVGHTANYMLLKTKRYHPYFFVALVNSYLMDFIFQTFNNTNHIPARELKRLPAHKINLNSLDEKKIYEDLLDLTDAMLDLNKKLRTIRGSGKDQLMLQIKQVDREIDSLVYRLYNLSENEVETIETSCPPTSSIPQCKEHFRGEL